MSNRTLVPVLIALVAGAAFGRLAWSNAAIAGTREMRELVIVDGEGRPRVVLGSHDGRQPGVWVLDEEERVRIGLFSEPATEERTGSSQVELYSRDRGRLVSLAVGHDEYHVAPTGLSFWFGGDDDVPYLTLGRSGGFADVGGELAFFNREGKRFLALEAGRVDGGPQLLMRSHDWRERDDPQRTIYVGMKQLRDLLTVGLYAGGGGVELRIDEDGEPSVRLKKENEQRSFAID